MEQKPCKIYYCYKATNKDNGKVYIGFASDPQMRWREHKRDAEKGRGYIFHDAIRKHGWDAFEFEVICCGTDKKTMLEQVEPTLIEQYHSSIGQNGYNMHRKVMGASSRNVDKRRHRTSEEMRNAHLAAQTLEARKKRSETCRLRMMTPMGKEQHRILVELSHTLELRKKHSERMKFLATTEIGKRNLRKAVNGRTKETYAKVSAKLRKLDLDVASTIRNRIGLGEMSYLLAKEYGVSESVISEVKHRKGAYK